MHKPGRVFSLFSFFFFVCSLIGILQDFSIIRLPVQRATCCTCQVASLGALPVSPVHCANIRNTSHCDFFSPTLPFFLRRRPLNIRLIFSTHYV